LPTKLAWKRGINLNIAVKWTNKLSEEVERKSTMKLCNRDILKIHDVHPVWSSLPAVKKLSGLFLLTVSCLSIRFFNFVFSEANIE
jgi:hypothetical protein